MEINASGLASSAINLNQANVGQDILLKTLEKGEEVKLNQKTGDPRPVERPQAERQGRIDLYA